MAVAPSPIGKSDWNLPNYSYGKSDWELSWQSYSRSDWSLPASPTLRSNIVPNDDCSRFSPQLITNTVSTAIENNHQEDQKQENNSLNRRVAGHNNGSCCCCSPPLIFAIGIVLALLCIGIVLGIVLGLYLNQKKQQSGSSSLSIISTISSGAANTITSMGTAVSSVSSSVVSTSVTSSTTIVSTTSSMSATPITTASASPIATTTATPFQICSDYFSNNSVLYFVNNPSTDIWTYPTYINYSYNYTATSTSATLAFYFRHDPGGWMLDDVTVYYGNTQLITNGGFETGNLNGWTYGASGGSCNHYTGQAYQDSFYSTNHAHGGTYYYYDRCNSACDVIRQSFTTVAGGTYLINFYMTNYDCCTTTEIAGITIT